MCVVCFEQLEHLRETATTLRTCSQDAHLLDGVLTVIDIQPTLPSMLRNSKAVLAIRVGDMPPTPMASI
jgi:hypothetical protein